MQKKTWEGIGVSRMVVQGIGKHLKATQGLGRPFKAMEGRGRPGIFMECLGSPCKAFATFEITLNVTSPGFPPTNSSSPARLGQPSLPVLRGSQSYNLGILQLPADNCTDETEISGRLQHEVSSDIACYHEPKRNEMKSNLRKVGGSMRRLDQTFS